MPSYGYVAIDKKGREKKGSMEVESEEVLNQTLKSQGYIVLEVKKQNMMTKDIDLAFLDKAKPRDLAIFCRQLVSMLHAGVAIIDAFGMLEASTENKTLKRAIGDVKTEIEKGEALSDAMSVHPVFPEMLIHMVRAGEASGTLETSFNRMATQFEKDAKINGQIKKAMTYPIMVLIVAIGVIIVLLSTIVPSFTGMFAEMDIDLPGLTKFIVALSHFMQSSWFIVVGILLLIALGIYYFRKSKAGKRFFSQMGLSIPMFHNYTVKTNSSRFARTLSTLIGSGVSMVDAIEITKDTIPNVIFQDAIDDAKEEVLRGVPLSRPLENCGLFPPMVYYMVRIGEESGDIESMLGKLADYYDEEVENATQSLLAALEPAIIVVLALIVAVILGGALGPMVTLYQNMDAL